MPNIQNKLLNILIAEDDKFLMQALEKKFDMEGFKVVQAFDGEEARNTLKTYIPDLILLDLLMPKLSGKDLLKEIKADERLRNVPVIILTNQGSFENLSETLKMGANRFIIKSDSDLDNIVKNVREVIAETSNLTKFRAGFSSENSTTPNAVKGSSKSGFLLALAVLTLLLVIASYELISWYVNNGSSLDKKSPIGSTATKNTPVVPEKANPTLGNFTNLGNLTVKLSSVDFPASLISNNVEIFPDSGTKFLVIEGLLQKPTLDSLKNLDANLESGDGNIFIPLTTKYTFSAGKQLSELVLPENANLLVDSTPFVVVFMVNDTTSNFTLNLSSGIGDQKQSVSIGLGK